MKLNYQYRWWYGILLLCFIIGIEFVFVLQDDYRQYVQLQKQYISKRDRYIAIQQSKLKGKEKDLQRSYLTGEAMLHEILQLCWLTDLHVQKISQEIRIGEESLLFKFNVTGSYAALMDWLRRLSLYETVRIHSFHLMDTYSSFETTALQSQNEKVAVGQHHYTITLSFDRVANRKYLSPSTHESLTLISPFCSSSNDYDTARTSTAASATDIRKLPISHFKMIGVITKNNEKQVIFALPKNKFLVSHAGSIISSLHAKIINIGPYAVVLRLPDGHSIKLLRKENT